MKPIAHYLHMSDPDDVCVPTKRSRYYMWETARNSIKYYRTKQIWQLRAHEDLELERATRKRRDHKRRRSSDRECLPGDALTMVRAMQRSGEFRGYGTTDAGATAAGVSEEATTARTTEGTATVRSASTKRSNEVNATVDIQSVLRACVLKRAVRDRGIQVALQNHPDLVKEVLDYQPPPAQNQPDNYHGQPDSPPHGVQEQADYGYMFDDLGDPHNLHIPNSPPHSPMGGFLDNHHSQHIPDSPPHGAQEQTNWDAYNDRCQSRDDKMKEIRGEEFVGHELDREQNGLGSPLACFARRVVGSSERVDTQGNTQYVGDMCPTVVSGQLEEVAPLVIHAMVSGIFN